MLIEFAHFDLLEAIKSLALLNQIPFCRSISPSLSYFASCFVLRIIANATLWSAEEYCTKMMPSIRIVHKMYFIHPKTTETTINDFVLFFSPLFLFLMKPWNAINNVAQFRYITIAFNCSFEICNSQTKNVQHNAKMRLFFRTIFLLANSYDSMENFHDKNDIRYSTRKGFEYLKMANLIEIKKMTFLVLFYFTPYTDHSERKKISFFSINSKLFTSVSLKLQYPYFITLSKFVHIYLMLFFSPLYSELSKGWEFKICSYLQTSKKKLTNSLQK